MICGKKNFFQKICKNVHIYFGKKKKKNFKKYAKSEYSEKIKKYFFCIKYAKSIISEKKTFFAYFMQKVYFLYKSYF